MDIDPQYVRSMLRVNGLSDQSSPEEIKGLLVKAGYTETEAQSAFTILSTPPSTTPAAASNPAVPFQSMPTAYPPPARAKPSSIGMSILLSSVLLACILLGIFYFMGFVTLNVS